MSTLETVALGAHVVIAILIVVFVLLQRGKGADAGAGFGAGASGTVFGARGSANFFSRMTAILATAFFATSLFLAYLATQEAAPARSVLDSIEAAPVDDGVDSLPSVGDDAESVMEDTVDDLPSLDTAEEADADSDEQ